MSNGSVPQRKSSQYPINAGITTSKEIAVIRELHTIASMNGELSLLGLFTAPIRS